MSVTRLAFAVLLGLAVFTPVRLVWHGPCQEIRRGWRQVEDSLVGVRRVVDRAGLSTALEGELSEAKWIGRYDEIYKAYRKYRYAADSVQRAIGTRPLSRRCLVKPLSQPWEFPVLSRIGIDGALAYVFAALGSKTRTAIEIDGGSGRGCYRATAGLASFLGWDAYAFLTSWSAYALTNDLLNNRQSTTKRNSLFPEPPKISSVEAQITATNVDKFIKENLLAGEVDLLCLFTDTDDFLIWKHLSQVVPRIVLVSYQEYWGPEISVVRDTSGTHKPQGVSDSRDILRKRLFVGASLSAFMKLGGTKGYSLIGCLSTAPIAIFAHRERTEQVFREISAADCLAANRRDEGWRRDMAAQWDDAQSFKWTKV